MAPSVNELARRSLAAEPPGGELVRLRRPAPGGGLAIDIAGLAKSFGAQEVLRTVSLTVRPGEFLAIVGHSGCGKSTLLRLVAGLETPTRGSVAVGGAAVTAQVAAARIMFQDARLLPWRRVIDNVGIGRKGEWRAAAEAALRAVGLESRAGDWPAILSGGQRQRVALARALVSRPKLLLLDEPLGALDALTRLEMQDLLEQVWLEQGFTALLVTHDVAEAVALADRVIVLEDGMVALEQQIPHRRPRPRGDGELAAIEGAILANLLRRGGRPLPRGEAS
ncbi:MAG: ATP-binding cassette domain-containing protein [Stellaceae bacterium]